MKLRIALLALAAFAIVIVAGGPRGLATLVQQRDQIAVTVLINVTPAPLGYRPADNLDAPPAEIALNMTIHGRGSAPADVPADLIAQVTQRPVRVEAEVTPNPAATLLYTDQSEVQINTTAGTTTTVPCIFHVTVQTTQTYWLLKHGLSNDFENGSGAEAFSGTDLSNNTYIATPHPAPTPYIVYADDGGNWALADTNSLEKTYCVDLTTNVPSTVAGGTYASNIIYTVYY
jgi:hypothetical protein